MKVAIYCRLSEEDRNKQSENDDSQSIQNQKSMLIQYAIEQDWEIFNIYSDDDYSGADRNRPEFNRMIEDAESRKFNIVLCKTQSRFSRELEIVEKYIHGYFGMWNIRFVSIVDNADTANKANKKSRQINGLVNEWYLEEMSDNIKYVLTNRRKNGFHIGAFALYGYLKDPDKKGHLIIDEEAAEIVREVFTLFSKGYGKTAIARILNERGIPNPTEYKRRKGLRYKPPQKPQSTLWKYFAVADMLTNEIYIGNLVQGKYGSVSYKSKQNKPRAKDDWIIVEGTHEPIIDMALWNKVQNLLKERFKPFITGNIGIFAKKVKCMYCDYTLRSCKNHGRHYLKCSTKHASPDACQGSFVAVIALEGIVLKELHRLNKEYLDTGLIAEGISFQSRMADRIAHLKRDISRLEKSVCEAADGIKSLYTDKTKGIISDADFIELSKSYHEDKERYLKQIKANQDLIAELEQKILTAENKKDLIGQYTGAEKLDREMVDTLIDCIYVGKRDPVTKELPIEIQWNF